MFLKLLTIFFFNPLVQGGYEGEALQICAFYLVQTLLYIGTHWYIIILTCTSRGQAINCPPN